MRPTGSGDGDVDRLGLSALRDCSGMHMLDPQFLDEVADLAPATLENAMRFVPGKARRDETSLISPDNAKRRQEARDTPLSTN